MKLTDDDVRLIRELAEERAELLRRAGAISNRNLAAKFGISRDHVDQIVRYRRRVKPKEAEE